MPAGLIKIITYGAQDLFLTGSPDITFFKLVYMRYTNFSTESYEVPFDDGVGFGRQSNLVLLPLGDLVHKMYLKIKIPEVKFTRLVRNQDIILAKQKFDIAREEYNRCIAFTQANMSAYRAILEIYSADNIVNCVEMIESILLIFDSYRLSNSSIVWFDNNSPIRELTPIKFNLYIIALSLRNNIDYVNIAKISLKNLAEDAIYYNTKIQIYYETQLIKAREELEDILNTNKKFAWTDKLGHSIIDYVDIYIGGSKIDRHYGIWLDIWMELAGKKNLEETYMKMIGQVPELTDFNRDTKPSYILYVPLQFWFNKFNGLALPLVALQYHHVTLSVKFKTFQDCAYVEDTQPNALDQEPEILDDYLDNHQENTIRDLEASVLIDYIFLGAPERKKFAQASHEYLIDQVQVLKIEDISNPTESVVLDFYHPCKELIWTVRKNAYIENKDGHTKCRWTNYTISRTNKNNPTIDASLMFNGYSRFDRLKGAYFNYVQPYQHHSNTPADGVNVYSFALRPEEHQPSGSCNFSRISKASLNIQFDERLFIDDGIETKAELWIFTVNHNVLRILSGMGAIAFE